MPVDIAEDEFEYRYRKEFGLTVAESQDEPWEAKWQAKVRWSLQAEQAERAEYEARMQAGRDVLN